MRLLLASMLLLGQTSLVLAQAQPDVKPPSSDQTPAPPNTDAQIAMMGKELDALIQLILQNPRGLIV